ncbi:MAG: formimidoylglutamate deiminase [Longimicrobiales bacterium]
MTILLPDLLYHDHAFRTGLAVAYDATSGRIDRVAKADSLGDAEVTRLPGRALIPGFINCHSHSFQRVIRGRTQWKPAHAEASDFWSWRLSMYQAVLSIEPDALYDVARFCFMEMLCAGYTTVGEFHYVQRNLAGGRYGDGNELAHRIIAAAESVGIRICLLNVCYATGAIDQPLWPEQRRFATPDVQQFLADTDALVGSMNNRTLVSVGVAPHSVRAVPRPWVREIHEYASERGMPLHMHVSEQPAEVEECVQVHGLRPGALLANDGILDARFTGIHGTHLDDAEIALFGAARASVCLCPTTERDLGDGLARIAGMINADVSLCIGTDSQSVIDPLEELRLIEYNERLRLLRRVVAARGYGSTDRLETAPVLMAIGGTGGAKSLGIHAGAFETGMAADFAAINLEHDGMTGWDAETLGPLLTLSAPASVVSDVWVGGVQRVHNGRHADREAVSDAFRRVARLQK